MKEHSILFSAPMVRAILNGNKTMTRRPLRIQPTDGWSFEQPPVFGRITSNHPKKGKFGVFIRRGVGTDFPESDIITCPYGMPGDHLSVRETWRIADWTDDGKPIIYYAADLKIPRIACDRGWRPSIFMPSWASRITLEITRVRVEHLQDITEDDAVREGVDFAGHSSDVIRDYSADERFSMLWTSINGHGSWNAC